MSFAEKILKPISTRSKNAAPHLVLTDSHHASHSFAKVKAIRFIGEHDVYNLEVEGHHNFSVNGGLIVHNCIDAARYACEDEMNTRPAARSLGPKPAGL